MRNTGNTMSEYTLIGILIAVVTIAVWHLLGDNLQGELLSFKTDMQSTNAAAENTHTFRQAMKDARSELAKSQNGQNSMGSQATMTSGANGSQSTLGTAGNYAGGFMRIAKTPQQAAKLAIMSNMMHEMAGAAFVVEMTFSHADNNLLAFKTTPVTFNGRTFKNAEALAYYYKNTFADEFKQASLNAQAMFPTKDDQVVVSMMESQVIDLQRQLYYGAKKYRTSEDPDRMAAQIGNNELQNQKATETCYLADGEDDGKKCTSAKNVTSLNYND